MFQYQNIKQLKPRQWLAGSLCAVFLGSIPGAFSMDLLQVYQSALKQDATLQAVRFGANAEQERTPQARAQLLPSLSLSFTHNNNQLESSTPDFLGKEQTTQRNYSSSNQTLSLRQPLFRPQLWAQYRQAKAQAADAEAVLANEEQTLAVRVCGSYFEAMLAHDQLALVLAQQKTYKTQLDAVRKAFEAGNGTRTDIDEAQARLDMGLAQEIEARQNVIYTMQQLQTFINAPITSLSLLDSGMLEKLPLENNDLEQWIQKTESNSAQLRSLSIRITTAEEEIHKNQSAHYPTLDVIAQVQKSTSENVTNTNNRYNSNSLGLQLNIPLYAGGYYTSAVRQAQANLDRAQQNYEAGKRSLSLQVHKEYRGVKENMAKIKALEQALRSAEQLVTSSQKSYQGGSRTVIDILNAEQQKALVQRDLSQARYMYLFSKVKLLSLADMADEAAIQEINKIFKNAF